LKKLIDPHVHVSPISRSRKT